MSAPVLPPPRPWFPVGWWCRACGNLLEDRKDSCDCLYEVRSEERVERWKSAHWRQAFAGTAPGQVSPTEAP